MKKFLKVFWRLLAVLLVTGLFALINAAGAGAMLAHGPSSAWQSQFAEVLDEDGPRKFVQGLFFSDEEVEQVLHPTPEPEVPDPFQELAMEPETEQPAAETPVAAEDAEQPEEADQTNDVIELVRIKEPTFHGGLLMIHDPSLVVFGSLDHFGGQGMLLTDFIDKYGAIGGINGAGFYAPGGSGSGGSPDGMVIRDGQFVHGSAGGWYRDVVGFDADYTLHVGDMSGREALDLGLVSAFSFNVGPVLIKDGEIQPKLSDNGSNPRTAIGQTADGTVLLLVIEGRRPDSLGATNQDMAEILYEYGAINAGNLDGGGSSDMYYRGEHVIYNDYMLRIPTAILVMDPDKGEQ